MPSRGSGRLAQALALMNRSFLFCLLSVAATVRAQVTDDVYLVNFAVFPIRDAQGCALVGARDVNQRSPPNFHPSLPFMKAACVHFRAIWQSDVPLDVDPAYKTAVWHRDSPDVPTFMQEAQM